MVIEGLIRLLLTVGVAFVVGKLVSKLRLPAILGWLLTGMVLGPHAFGLLDSTVLDAAWYGTAEHIAALKQYGPAPIHRRSFIGHFVEG